MEVEQGEIQSLKETLSIIAGVEDGGALQPRNVGDL